jgi:stress-induced morphogen
VIASLSSSRKQKAMLRRVVSRLCQAAGAGEIRFQPSEIEAKLRSGIADVSQCNVQDISGGCGSFYKVSVVSPSFEGKTPLGQHRMVHEALKDVIPKIHGLTIETSVTPK